MVIRTEFPSGIFMAPRIASAWVISLVPSGTLTCATVTAGSWIIAENRVTLSFASVQAPRKTFPSTAISQSFFALSLTAWANIQEQVIASSAAASMFTSTLRIVVGCGSFEVSWLRCEDESVAVSGVVNAFVLAAEVEAPVGVEVAAGEQGAEFQDGLGAFESPSCARYVHSVLYEPACRALDYPGGNGPAFLQR